MDFNLLWDSQMLRKKLRFWLYTCKSWHHSFSDLRKNSVKYDAQCVQYIGIPVHLPPKLGETFYLTHSQSRASKPEMIQTRESIRVEKLRAWIASVELSCFSRAPGTIFVDTVIGSMCSRVLFLLKVWYVRIVHLSDSYLWQIWEQHATKVTLTVAAVWWWAQLAATSGRIGWLHHLSSVYDHECGLGRAGYVFRNSNFGTNMSECIDTAEQDAWSKRKHKVEQQKFSCLGFLNTSHHRVIFPSVG